MKEHSRHQAIEVVRAGYDKLAELYATEREKFDNWAEVKAFTSKLPEAARVLDAGSGTGTPIAEFLVRSGFEVVGIDISPAMVETARKNIPGTTFLQMDMTRLDFPPASFDGVISTYAIIHVPRETHAGLFESFYRVLKSGGTMLVSVASWEWEEFADYMGVDMFWSHYDSDRNESLITAAGFEIEFGCTVESGGETHHWVLAHKR
ncbi:MAG: methyltransferase domain-containing protein [Candidatus Zixiibacteriota bacterium]|nr:MAG: methyltransferase domain-containing protein [candidate division Zixibacteria bacterium]